MDAQSVHDPANQPRREENRLNSAADLAGAGLPPSHSLSGASILLSSSISTSQPSTTRSDVTVSFTNQAITNRDSALSFPAPGVSVRALFLGLLFVWLNSLLPSVSPRLSQALESLLPASRDGIRRIIGSFSSLVVFLVGYTVAQIFSHPHASERQALLELQTASEKQLSENTTLRQSIQEKSDQIRELEISKERRLKQYEDDLRCEQSKCAESIQLCVSQIARLDSTIGALSRRLEESQSSTSIVNLQVQITAMEAKKRDLEATIDRLTREKEELSTRLMCTRVDQRWGSVAELDAYISALKKKSELLNKFLSRSPPHFEPTELARAAKEFDDGADWEKLTADSARTILNNLKELLFRLENARTDARTGRSLEFSELRFAPLSQPMTACYSNTLTDGVWMVAREGGLPEAIVVKADQLKHFY